MTGLRAFLFLIERTRSYDYFLYKNNYYYFASSFKWITVDVLPMVKDTLWEGLTLSETSKVSSETE
jgi:hypothetical protein